MTIKPSITQLALGSLLISGSAYAVAADKSLLQQAIKHTEMAASASEASILAEHAEQASHQLNTLLEHLNQAAIHLRDAKDHANQKHLEPAQNSAKQAKIHLDAAK